MFDAIHLHTRNVTESVTRNVNVTEKRAPTDESVKLLREMEKAALDSIIASIRLTDAPVDAVLHHHRSHQTGDFEFRIIYKLGGAKRLVDYQHREFTGTLKDLHEQVAFGLRDALAKDIANGLMDSMFKAVAKAISGIA